MLMTTFAASLIMLQAANAAPDAATEDTKADKPEITVTGRTEKSANAGKITDRNHPDYIRCRREAVIGSRAKRKKTCMTNREWEDVARSGNRDSRDLLNDNQPGFLGGNN